MKPRQLSLFLENRPGQLRAPCEALGRAGIDILGVALADTAHFGILRLIVKDWRRAKELLEKEGCVVNVTEVVAVEVDDQPGGLSQALAVIDRAGLGIEYMYAFLSWHRAGKAAVVFRFDEPDRAVAAMAEGGLRVIEEEELLVHKAS